MKNKNSPNKEVAILIAEDSPTQAAQLQHLLSEHGYAATTAVNGREALEAMHRHKPALVISDILMPELDGYGLCKAIKSDGKLKDIPVILVTTLSDPQDVVRGLECGADNFIHKPYDEQYLLARIEYLLINLDLRENQKMQMGVEIDLGGQKHFITAERQQILDLLISTYEQAIHINEDLKAREKDLAHSNQVVNGLYRIAEGLNQLASEQQVAEMVLERALELPGIMAGWILLREGDTGVRLAATRNLPPVLAAPGALEGDCQCRRNLLAEELGATTSIIQCERLARAKGDTQGLRYHASVPLWLGGRALGTMNLVGQEDGIFNEDELKMLYGVGNQVALALERARLHEHLEQLVEERTVALRASEARLRTIIEAEPECVKIVDAEGRLVQINAAGLAMIEADSFEQVQGSKLAELVVPAQQEAYRNFEASVLDGKSAAFEFEIAGLKGTHRWLDSHAVPLPDPQDGCPQILAITRDVTERKANEAKIQRLNRIYSVLSGINTTIVRVHEEDELFKEACRIAVEHGKFVFAWIGKFDAASQQVTPVAQSGRDDGYLAQINLTARENIKGSCALTSQALTEVKPVVCNDIASDERMADGRSEALSRGYRSATIFPLVLEGRPVGVFALYASELGAFDDEEMKLLIEMAGDISFALDHIEKEERLNYLAYYDALTGLSNRTLFFDRLSQILHAAGAEGERVAMLVLDLERFRNINETLGRQAGDSMLRQVAERLAASGLDRNHLARIGADCFGIVLINFNKESEVAHYFENIIMGSLGQPFMVGENELRISAKAGIAMFPGDGGNPDTLLRNAEAALAKAKLSGDRYSFYTPELNAQVAENLTLENKLRRAMEQGQFVLHYQPKISLKNGQIEGVEALIRWNDPDTGLVPPVKFIPLLEETGMILEVGKWALQKAVSDALLWLENGLKTPRVAVNVSSIQLRQNDFVDMIKTTMNGDARAIQYLELEITESLIMKDIEANIQKLNMIREMSATVAIDDFGTGYSSLSYIAKLPVNTLKIDRAFIINMASNPDDLSIVSAIISLAHSLDMKVVAEGVETLEQANLLRLLKCDEIQGFLFSPAVPAEQISIFLKEKKSLLM